ncbi:cyclic nucleotide-binding domain-containing protein, partial [Rhodoferax sp.]|uniref:cyclic nucleotide-binding domain-containing protein n=1 Tax=Rhodoferax sp. TaxID=50421 RepID=UPI003BB6BFA3
MPTDYPEQVLIHHLQSMLGEVDADAMQLLRRHLTWLELAAGDTLMVQGEPGDAMYLSISGRLRASVLGDDGVERMVREMGRGEVIGEMSLYTDEPRTATVVAIRNSVLVRLAKSEFTSLLASSAQMSIALTRQMIQRLTRTSPRTAVPPPVAMALLPVTAEVDTADFARRLADQLGHMGRVCLVDAAGVDAALQLAGLAQSAISDAAANRRIASH